MYSIETECGYVNLDFNNMSINDLKALSAEINAARLRKGEEEKKEAVKEIADFICNKLDEVEGLNNCTFYYYDNYDDESTFDLEGVVKGLINWL